MFLFKKKSFEGLSLAAIYFHLILINIIDY